MGGRGRLFPHKPSNPDSTSPTPEGEAGCCVLFSGVPGMLNPWKGTAGQGELNPKRYSDRLQRTTTLTMATKSDLRFSNLSNWKSVAPTDMHKKKTLNFVHVNHMFLCLGLEFEKDPMSQFQDSGKMSDEDVLLRGDVHLEKLEAACNTQLRALAASHPVTSESKPKSAGSPTSSTAKEQAELCEWAVKATAVCLAHSEVLQLRGDKSSRSADKDKDQDKDKDKDKTRPDAAPLGAAMRALDWLQECMSQLEAMASRKTQEPSSAAAAEATNSRRPLGLIMVRLTDLSVIVWGQSLGHSHGQGSSSAPDGAGDNSDPASLLVLPTPDLLHVWGDLALAQRHAAVVGIVGPDAARLLRPLSECHLRVGSLMLSQGHADDALRHLQIHAALVKALPYIPASIPGSPPLASSSSQSSEHSSSIDAPSVVAIGDPEREHEEERHRVLGHAYALIAATLDSLGRSEDALAFDGLALEQHAIRELMDARN